MCVCGCVGGWVSGWLNVLPCCVVLFCTKMYDVHTHTHTHTVQRTGYACSPVTRFMTASGEWAWIQLEGTMRFNKETREPKHLDVVIKIIRCVCGGGGGERGRRRQCVCVCVCVCVCEEEGERERERVSVCVCVCVYVYVSGVCVFEGE